MKNIGEIWAIASQIQTREVMTLRPVNACESPEISHLPKAIQFLGVPGNG